MQKVITRHRGLTNLWNLHGLTFDVIEELRLIKVPDLFDSHLLPHLRPRKGILHSALGGIYAQQNFCGHSARSERDGHGAGADH
jgi:hypothetical protein